MVFPQDINNKKNMKIAIALGIIMIVLGIYGLFYDSIKSHKVVKVKTQKEESGTVPIPAIFGGLSVAGGVGFVIIGIKSERSID